MRHKKGTGYIFKRGDVWYHRTKINGCIRVTCLQETDERKARAKADREFRPIVEAKTKEILAIHVADARKLAKRTGVKIANAFELYLKNKSRPDSGERQLNDYKAQWTRFENYLKDTHQGMVYLADIDKDAVKGFADYLDALSICARTFNKSIAAVALIVRILAEEAGLEGNPFDCIHKKGQDTVHKKELTEAEAMRLLNVFETQELRIPYKEEMKLCFHVGMFSGLRFSDAVNLRFKQLALDEGLIKLKPSKTKRTSGIEITIPVHPVLREMLEKAIAAKTEGQEFVMPQLARRFETHKIDLNKEMIAIFTAAGFATTEKREGRLRDANVYGFHSFRSTFCSFAARKGVPLSTLAQITGDNIQTLQKYYVRIDAKTAAQTVNALPMLQQTLPQGSNDGFARLKAKVKELVDQTNMATLKIIADILEKGCEGKLQT